MLGTGRPFLVEIQNARQFPSDVLVKDMENKINSLENKLVSFIDISPLLDNFYFLIDLLFSSKHWPLQVRVKNLKVFGSQGWELMREGEAEKQVIALFWMKLPYELAYLSFCSIVLDDSMNTCRSSMLHLCGFLVLSLAMMIWHFHLSKTRWTFLCSSSLFLSLTVSFSLIMLWISNELFWYRLEIS